MVTIREMTAEDVPAVLAMGTVFLQTIYRGVLDPDQTALARLGAYFMDLVDKAGAVSFLAVRDGALVGMIALMIFDHPMSGERTCSELAWWVNPDARGCGVRLFRTAEAWARAQGAVAMHVTAPNADVERFYARVGYTPIERSFQRRLA